MTPHSSAPIVTLVPGDGVGPEVTAAAREVIDASGAAIEWDVQQAGKAALADEGTPLPDRVVESIASCKVALKGPLETARDMPFGSPNVALRERLGLHTTIRPCRAFGGVGGTGRDADVVVVKMNREDLYARLGFEGGSTEAENVSAMVSASTEARISPGSAISLRPLSEEEVARVVEAAIHYARAHGRRRVTAVHKAQLVPATDGMFLEVARAVAGRHPDVEFDDALVDTVCERLVTRPEAYDVLVMSRMYGDIVSGVAAALIGGPGLAPGLNLGGDCAVFEAAHGTVPRLAGSDRANPMAVILSGALLLHHLGQRDAAARIEAGVAAVLREGRTLTYDLARDSEPRSTSEVAAAVVAALEAPRGKG